MQKMNNIEKTIEFLKSRFDASEYLTLNPEAKAYRFEHTIRVANWGKKIAQAENLNEEALVIGCLLHDISYCEEQKNKEERLNHGRRSAEISKDFLMSLDIQEDLKKEILYGIGAHVDGKTDCDGKPTVLSRSINSSDNLDRFDIYRIHESLIFEQFTSMSLEEKIKHCVYRIDTSKKLLEIEMATKYATNIFHKELEYIIQFFNALKIQLEKSTTDTII